MGEQPGPETYKRHLLNTHTEGKSIKNIYFLRVPINYIAVYFTIKKNTTGAQLTNPIPYYTTALLKSSSVSTPCYVVSEV